MEEPVEGTENKLDNIDSEKRAQVERIQVNTTRKTNTYEENVICVDGVEIGSMGINLDGGNSPQIDAVVISDPRYRSKGFGSASYMAYALSRRSDVRRGSTNAMSRRIWESLEKRGLVQNGTLKVDRITKHLGLPNNQMFNQSINR